MKVKVTSDTHGYFPDIDSPFDLLLICGDVCPAHDHYYAFQKNWIENDFVHWISMLPFKNDDSKVVMIGGNHDFFFERANKNDADHLKKLTNGRLIVLKNEEYTFECMDEDGLKSVKIFGTPYCKIFGSWAFMISNEGLAEKYDEIPFDVDILISHDSPTINNLGLIQEGWNAGVDAGNTILDKYIKERKPHYFFSGHIHSGNHTFEEVDGTKMANVSYINERYNPAYNVLEFDM